MAAKVSLMATTIISSKQVKSVTQGGIVYLDKEGIEQFIDFEECYQNYLKERLSPEAIESFKTLNNETDADVPAHIERIRGWKGIADRNVLGDGVWVDGKVQHGFPYFEFYAEPRVRIEFESKDELWEMRNKIESDFRWRTFDRT
jgi:hypothetical protein